MPAATNAAAALPRSTVSAEAAASRLTRPAFGFGTVPNKARAFEALSEASSMSGDDFHAPDEGMDEQFDPTTCFLCAAESEARDGLCEACHAARAHGEW